MTLSNDSRANLLQVERVQWQKTRAGVSDYENKPLPKSLLAAAILMALLTEPVFANEEQELNLEYGKELAIGEATFDAVESTKDLNQDPNLKSRLLKAEILLQGGFPVADAKGLEADLRSEIERKKLIDSDTSIATDFLMLGQLYIQLNRFVESEALLRNANAVATSSSQQNLAFQIQTNLGKAYAKQNKNTEAEIWLELAIETGLRTKDPELRQPVKALAELHVAKKEYDEAIVLWNFLIPPRSSNKPAPLGVLMAMAEIYETEKKLFEAEETLKEGVAASESWKAEAPPEVLPDSMTKASPESATASAIPTANMMAEKAQILAKLGAFYHRQNKFPQAIANYQKAVDIAEKIPSLDAATLKTYTDGLNSVKRNEPAL